MKKIKAFAVLLFSLCASVSFSQTLKWNNKEFETKAVRASIVKLNGEEVLKVERDLNALTFDTGRLEATVDEPTYVKLKNYNFKNGTIEVKMLSQIQNPSPFKAAQGFIGVAFRITDKDSAYESFYLRPKVGRSDNQFYRNHTVQYYSYPNYKFATLRKLSPETYETTAPVNINEWITMRIEVNNGKAELFINNAKYSTMIIDKLKGSMTHGSVALWVDIGTVGYFKDLKITSE